MKQMVKKFACVAIACAMVLSATACKKSDSKKESSGVVSAAEEILEALTSLNMKKIKKIDAFSDCLEDLQVLADCEPIAEMMKILYRKRRRRLLAMLRSLFPIMRLPWMRRTEIRMLSWRRLRLRKRRNTCPLT